MMKNFSKNIWREWNHVLYLPPWLNAIAERLLVHPIARDDHRRHEQRPRYCCGGIVEAYITPPWGKGRG